MGILEELNYYGYFIEIVQFIFAIKHFKEVITTIAITNIIRFTMIMTLKAIVNLLIMTALIIYQSEYDYLLSSFKKKEEIIIIIIIIKAKGVFNVKSYEAELDQNIVIKNLQVYYYLLMEEKKVAVNQINYVVEKYSFLYVITVAMMVLKIITKEVERVQH